MKSSESGSPDSSAAPIARMYGSPLADAFAEARARVDEQAREEELRKKLSSTVPFPEYADRPNDFAKEILGAKLWKFQRSFLDAIWTKRYVSVASCHKSGKSYALGCAVLTFLMTCPCIVITISPSKEHLTDVMWSEVRDQHAASRVPLPGNPDMTQFMFGPKHFAKGISTTKSERIHGRHAGVEMGDDPDVDLTEEEVIEIQKEAMKLGDLVRLVYIIDEATGVPAFILEALKGSLSGANVYFVLAGNPIIDLTADHEYARSHRVPELGYHRIHVAAEPCEMGGQEAEEKFHHIPTQVLPPSWKTKHKKAWGEKSALWKSKGLGLFAGADSDRRIISQEILQVAALRKAPLPGLGRHIGVDVAREGNDWSAASLFVDGVKMAEYRWEHARLYETAAIVERLRIQWGAGGEPVPAENVHIDAGMGGGAIDDLYKVGIEVDEVHFGEAASGDWSFLTGEMQFGNRRAEMHWVMRCALQKGFAQIPEKYAMSWEEAKWPEYRMKEETKGTVLYVEPKDEIKKKFGRSPDMFDADLLAFSCAVPDVPLIAFGIM